MQLSPIKKERIYQSIIKQIKTSVENGLIQAGDKLPSERALAEQLEVSRTAVREALSVLEASGIIEVLPGVGVFLKEPDEGNILKALSRITRENKDEFDLVQILEVREAIEVQAAGLAATRRTAQDLKRMKQSYDALDEAARRKTVAAEEDLHFHLAVVQASHNELLLQIAKLFRDTFLRGIQYFRHEDLKISPEDKISRDSEHLVIYEAIAAKDAKKARAAMEGHYKNVRLSYEKQIKPLRSG